MLMAIDISVWCEDEDAGNRHGRNSSSRAREVSCCTGHGLDDLHHLPRPRLWHRPLLPPSSLPFFKRQANNSIIASSTSKAVKE